MQVVLRTDATEMMGTGHLSRCLVLADAIKKSGGSCQFILGERNPTVARLLSYARYEVSFLGIDQGSTIEEDALATIGLLPPALEWLVVDHYGLDSRWEALMRPHVNCLLAIDDLANRTHDCNILVDPGYGRSEQDYAGLLPDRTQLLLGTRFAIMKDSFSERHNTAPRWPDVRRAHVYFGGGCSPDWLPRYVKILMETNHSLTVMAVGRANSRAMNFLLNQWVDRLTWHESVDDMAETLSSCDIAIGSPGTATWERACIGLPAGLLATNLNQVSILENLDRQGFCRFLGPAWLEDATLFTSGLKHFLSDSAALTAMRSLGVEAVDGRGIHRIVERMKIGATINGR